MLSATLFGAQSRAPTLFFRTLRTSYPCSALIHTSQGTNRLGKPLLLSAPAPFSSAVSALHRCSALSQGDAGNKSAPVSRKEKWKHAIKEYGSAMVAFHVVLSFTSFGICYVLVSSGVDLTAVAEKLGFSMDSQWVNSKMAGGSGTLVLAYAVHKLFTPVRMGITLSTTPILVRWLRRNGIWGFRY
ncbi:protein FAM210B, mitochondrial-like isoform X1 [Dermacentor silvarum]|uniref:protein FAM210B, mitochondrial-like isoform X1 n=1 Tax=Dermacentor silvarum TaxID=543639 RepID=UPI001898B820|nr:protein FAM210B, mitochondrial-like isoform X1 [Dermacentor silvarum]